MILNYTTISWGILIHRISQSRISVAVSGRRDEYIWQANVMFFWNYILNFSAIASKIISFQQQSCNHEIRASSFNRLLLKLRRLWKFNYFFSDNIKSIHTIYKRLFIQIQSKNVKKTYMYNTIFTIFLVIKLYDGIWQYKKHTRVIFQT